MRHFPTHTSPTVLSESPRAASPCEQAVGEASRLFSVVRDRYGFVPNILRAQAQLPRLIEAQLQISEAVLLRDGALPRWLKELIGLVIAADRKNDYSAAIHMETLRRLAAREPTGRPVVPTVEDLAPSHRAILQLALKVAREASSTTVADFGALRTLGLSDAHIVETVVTAAHSVFQCTVSTGLRVAPDFDVPDISPLGSLLSAEASTAPPGPHRPLTVATGPDVDTLAPLAFLRRAFGFIPNLFRVLMLRPHIAEAGASGVRLVLLPNDVLSRTQKENVFLVISAKNLNTYCVAAHCELLRGLGVSVERSDQIAVAHQQTDLPAGDKALLDVALMLALEPARFGSDDLATLRTHAFSDEQILEAVVMSGFAQFVNASSMGLVAEPDFALPPAFAAEASRRLNRPSSAPFDSANSPPPNPESDPDWAIVSRVQSGDIDAFEDLVRRHGRRVHLTLAGILRRDEDLEDAVQDTFIKAFQHLGGFQGRSTFLTWLTRIAINTALQRLRGRRDMESLSDSDDVGDDFRPRQLRAWDDNPEQAYSKNVMRELVWNAVMDLPLKYRVVVMLRDLQQLSTAETAAALDLGIQGVKARLFRGRLMLREALAPHFARKETTTTS